MPERPLPNLPTYHQPNESSAYSEPELDSPIPDLCPSPPPYDGMAEDSNTSTEHVGGKPLVIAVMGPTGSGKSTLISKLAGREVTIGHSLKSCTENIEEVACKVGDRYVILVDTPGFNDSTRSDTEILGVLADWMQGSYSDDLLLSGIIYLHCISDTRMTNTSIQNLRMFRKLCGDKNLQHVILTTTKWGITPEGDALRREEELKTAEGFWGLMIAHGALIRRFENTKESARALVEEILHPGQERFMPKIQEEVVNGMKLSETEAGAYLSKALLELSAKHEQEKKVLKEEMELAQKEQNQQLLDGLRVEYLRLWKDIARKEEDQRILHQSNIEALNERIRILEEFKQTQGGRLVVNEQKLWRVSWRCLGCRHKTSTAGSWTCPTCKLAQLNQK